MSELRWTGEDGENVRDVSALRFTIEGSVGKLMDVDLVQLVLTCALNDAGEIFRTADGLVARLAERK